MLKIAVIMFVIGVSAAQQYGMDPFGMFQNGMGRFQSMGRPSMGAQNPLNGFMNMFGQPVEMTRNDMQGLMGGMGINMYNIPSMQNMQRWPQMPQTSDQMNPSNNGWNRPQIPSNSGSNMDQNLLNSGSAFGQQNQTTGLNQHKRPVVPAVRSIV